MGLLSAKEVAVFFKLNSLGVFGRLVGKLFLNITRLSVLNKIYNRHKDKPVEAFYEGLINDLKFKVEISEADLKRIPKNGAFITVSNHPLGGIDGMLLLKYLTQERKDYKIIANFLLHRIAPIIPYVMPVNPFDNHKDAKSSVLGLKTALMHLKNGHPMGVFPAGEVSTIKKGKLVYDKAWEKGALKLIQKAKVPVIPVYFHAKNSPLFYRMAKWSPLLRTAKLPSEVLSQKDKVIKIRIGHSISVKDQQTHKSLKDFESFLKQKLYRLSKTIEKKTLFQKVPQRFKRNKTPEEIVAETPLTEIKKEIAQLNDSYSLLLKSKNYELYFATAELIPNILREIGRLREITFRAIGEGTNSAIDLDEFDETYHHLFLWDNEGQKIVGAYRMGLGKFLFESKGINGFYLQSFFRFEPELFSMMEQSIEMGRAFVEKSYQQKPMPLFLLWKGIVHVTLRYPEYKYLIGGVSISNQFSKFSKSLMIEFMKSHFYDPYLAQFVRPKKEFKVKLKDIDKEYIFDETKADLNKFDKIIDELEPDNLRLPVLIKKYVKQNAKVVAFNVDPLFNHSVDGLMYIKISDLPEDTVRPVMEEFQKQLEQSI